MNNAATSFTNSDHSILESLADGVVVLDREWRLTYLNQRQAEWFNLPREVAIGQTIWTLCPEWSAPEMQQKLHQALAHQTPVQLEYDCLQRQGWFELRVSPFSGGVTILTIDITQRKQKEVALQESESRFEAFMNHSPVSAWIVNESGHLLYLNPFYLETFSCDSSAIGKHISEIFSAEIAQQFIDNNQQVFTTDQALQTIEYVPEPNGNVRSYLVCKFPVVQKSGEKLLGGFAVDISEQKRTEAALQEREQQLQIALRTAKLGAWQHDLITNILTCSDQCKANFGVSADAEFTHETLFAALHPDDRDRVQAAIQQSIQERTDYEVEERCYHPDGSLHWLIARGGLVFDDNGNPIRLVGVTLDITERKQFEESLKAANQRISNILESITDAFIAFDQDWHYTYVNQAATRLLRKPAAELVGKRWQEVFPEVAHQGTIFSQHLEQVMAERVTAYCEGFSELTNCWLEASIFPANSGISVFLRDISDRKQEEQRKALQYNVSQILSSATTVLEVMPTLLETICAALRWPVALLWSLDRTRARLCCTSHWAASNQHRSFIQASQQTALTIGQGLPGRIWSNRQPDWITNVFQDHNFLRMVVAGEAGLQSGFGFPILLGDEFFGVIECFSNRTQTLDSDLLELMAAIGRQVGQFMERKRTEAALRESEELFHSFMSYSPVAAFIKDEAGQYVYVNGLIEQLFNRPASDLVGHTDSDWFPGEAIAQIRANDALVLTQNEPLQVIETVPLGDQVRHFMAFKFPLQDAFGRRFLGGMSVDITDRIQAETSLRQREEELRVITNTVPVLISFVDVDQRYRFNSQRYQDWFGQSPDEIEGKYLWEVLGAAAYEVVRPYVEQALAGQEVSFEHQLLYQPGTTRYISAHYIPLFNEQRQVTGFVALVNDISDRKRHEEALQATAERLNLALTAAKMGGWRWEAATDVVTFSQQAYEIFGIQPGTSLTWTQLRQRLEAQDQEKARIAVEQAISEHTDYDIEYRVMMADGSSRWIAAKGRAQYDVVGHVLSMMGVVQNITDRKQAEQEREQLLHREKIAREQAETANRIKDEFLAVLSHELRTPLNPILGWTKLLRTRDFDPQARDRALEIIERNAKLQTQLIEDLLDISRILRGKLRLNMQPVHLETVIESALETVRLPAEAKGIVLCKRFLEPTACVMGDAGRLQQVIWNLLSNAVKFTPYGGRVEVELEQLKGTQTDPPASSYAQITVMDNGKGISSQFLPYVFDYFRQEDSTTTRQFGGLGLGLAIVRYLTELHGGSVSVESAGENLGAMFTIQLPLLTQSQATSPLQEPSDFTRPEQSPLADLKILAVDDDTDMRDLLATVLTEYGAEVEVLSSAKAVLTALERTQPDILISDIGMPEMDGYALMQHVRAKSPEQGGSVPAIALTAYAGEINQQQAQKAGFQQHIAKPVEPEELVQAIVALLAKESNG